jgi:hypothetical protein
MVHPTCDNDCTRMGWIEAIMTNGTQDLHVSYPPETDLDDEFRAFCHDEQEMIRVKGWQIEGIWTGDDLAELIG